MDRRLLDDRSNDARANCTATFADREAQLFFHSDRNDQFNFNCYVVARHNHFNTFWQRNDTSHVSCTEVELWTVVGEERSMTAAFFLVQDVGFSHELLMWLNRTWLAKDLTALNAFACYAANQRADVVASLALIEQCRGYPRFQLLHQP
jgi:hypothetical protein